MAKLYVNRVRQTWWFVRHGVWIAWGLYRRDALYFWDAISLMWCRARLNMTEYCHRYGSPEGITQKGGE